MPTLIRNVGQTADSSGALQAVSVSNTDNADHNRIASSVYGGYPETVISAQEFIAGGADNAILYTSTDVSTYNYHAVENFAASANNIDVYVSLDGINFNSIAAAVSLLSDVTTGGGIKVLTIPPGEVGLLYGKFILIQCLQDGITNADGRILHGVV